MNAAFPSLLVPTWRPAAGLRCCGAGISSTGTWISWVEATGDSTIATTGKTAFKVGLTGGIASGKSTVADFFAELGVPIIDTDVIAREAVAPGAPALDTIRQQFGDTVIDDHGGLDRAAMRRIVFADDAKRARLEGILHPLIRNIAYQRADEASEPYVIIVVPLLFESPMREAMDRILVVDCSRDVQLERLLDRDNESREQAERIIASQASREERLSIADDVVRNDGDLASTRARVAELHENYLQMAAAGT